jgi:hypothetical protein
VADHLPPGHLPDGHLPDGHLPEAGDVPTLLSSVPGMRERQNTGTHQLDVSQYFSGADSYAIAPAVEAGWTFDTNTGLLTIDTDVVGTFGPYVVTATNAAGNADSNAFTVEVYALSSTGGKPKPRKPRRLLVQIDGQDFEVSSVEEARSLLEKAKTLAVEAAEETVVERTAARVKRGKRPKVVTPEITTDAQELKSLVSTYRDDIEAIYRQMAIDAEIGQLLRLKWQRELDDDDDEALFVLLH